MAKIDRMTREQARRIFPGASESVLALQPTLSTTHKDIIAEVTGKEIGRRDLMNQTESRYSRILEAQRQRGDIFSWEFQALTLCWGRDDKTGRKMRYKPDFFVRVPELSGHEAVGAGSRTHKIIEVKGGHIWDRDKVRFRGCRAEWQWLFDFELWQLKRGEWRQLE